MRKFKAMKPERYAKLIAKLKLSQQGAARFLGLAPRTSRRFISGHSDVDPRTAMLLELMVKHGISTDEALRSIGVDIEAAIRRAKPNAAPRYF